MGGRKPLVPGVQRSKLPPSDRGFCSVSLGEDTTKKLLAYMEVQGIAKKAAAIGRLLEARGVASSVPGVAVPAVSPAPLPAPSIPWDLIEEKLIDSLGQKWSANVLRALESVKAALE